MYKELENGGLSKGTSFRFVFVLFTGVIFLDSVAIVKYQGIE